jgi:tetratricopeptide (TPR) repeat protein
VQATEAADATGLTGRLLRVLAVLSADGTRRDLLSGLAGGGRADGSDYEVDRAVERCAAGSLLTWSVTGDTVVMHRLLGRVLRERDQVGGQWPGPVTAALDLLEPLLIPPDQSWSRRQEGAHLITQTEALWEAAGAGPVSQDLCRRLLRTRIWAVRQLMAAADLSRAIGNGTRVLADCEQFLGPDDPDTLTTRNDLADAYDAVGKQGAAIPLYERTLADRQRVLGADDPETLSSGNKLAGAYAGAARLDEAISLHEQVLADYERILGPDHPGTLISRGDLGYAYWFAGRLDDAISQFERILFDYERVLGPDHSDTLRTRHHLAVTHASAGRLDEAIVLHERTLADRERILGMSHPHTLTSRDHLERVRGEAKELGRGDPPDAQN